MRQIARLHFIRPRNQRECLEGFKLHRVPWRILPDFTLGQRCHRSKELRPPVLHGPQAREGRVDPEEFAQGRLKPPPEQLVGRVRRPMVRIKPIQGKVGFDQAQFGPDRGKRSVQDLFHLIDRAKISGLGYSRQIGACVHTGF